MSVMKVNVVVQIRQRGPVTETTFEGQPEVLCSISTAAAQADETLWEDFQALSMKVAKCMIEGASTDSRKVTADSYCKVPEGN